MASSKAKRVYGAEGLTDAPTFDPEVLVLVTDKTHPLYQDRVHLEPDPAFVDNVAMLGVIVPVVVRKNGTRKNGTPIYEVIDGRQRVSAARLVNKDRKKAGVEPLLVPAHVRRSGEDKAFDEMIGSNLRIAIDTLQQAKDLARYLDGGRTEEDAMVVFGLPNKRAVRNMLALNDCSSQVQKAVAAGEVTLTVARSWSTLPASEQNSLLSEARENGETRGKATTEKAKKVERKQRIRAPFKHRPRAGSVLVQVREETDPEAVAKIHDVIAWVLRETDTIPEV